MTASFLNCQAASPHETPVQRWLSFWGGFFQTGDVGEDGDQRCPHRRYGKELPRGWGCEVVFPYIQTKPPENTRREEHSSLQM